MPVKMCDLLLSARFPKDYLYLWEISEAYEHFIGRG